MTTITKAELIVNSPGYHRKYIVNESDVLKANELRQLIEQSRDKSRPRAGDLIICKGQKKTYERGHVGKHDLSAHNAICVQPYVPFVFIYGHNKPTFDASGGYWFSHTGSVKYIGTDEKMFKAWGWLGACADGAFYFKAKVNVWEIYSKNVY